MLDTGVRIGVVQVIKSRPTGERTARGNFGDRVVEHSAGEGFAWVPQDTARGMAACRGAWTMAREATEDPSIGLVILDELNIALRDDKTPRRR